MTDDPLRFAVLGPGGVGGLLAALLWRAGDSVLVLARDHTALGIARGGLTIESARFGDFTARVHTAGRLRGPVDVCFITVKSTHLSDALWRVPAEVLGGGLIIPLLNGLDHVGTLRTVYPASSVVAATIRIESDRPEAGIIRQSSPVAAVEIATSNENRGRVELIAARLRSAGLDVLVRDDEAAMLWDKFAMLAPLALLTTHERANLGVIRSRRRTDLIAVVTEVTSVAKAEGITIDPARILRVFDGAPETLGSSMQRDEEAGRPLELDSIGEVILRRAAKEHVAVPVTTRLVADLRARSVGRASESA